MSVVEVQEFACDLQCLGDAGRIRLLYVSQSHDVHLLLPGVSPGALDSGLHTCALLQGQAATSSTSTTGMWSRFSVGFGLNLLNKTLKAPKESKG